MLVYSLFSAGSAIAQPQNQVQQSYGFFHGSCVPGDDSTCCAEFTFTVEAPGTTWFKLNIQGDATASVSCLDTNCSHGTFIDGGLTNSRIRFDPGNPYTLDLISLDSSGWNAGTVIHVVICPKWPGSGALCWELWRHYTWNSYGTWYPSTAAVNSSGGDVMNWCGHPWGCLSKCDTVHGTVQGTTEEFCITRRCGLEQTSQIVVNIVPALQHPCNDDITWDGKCYWSVSGHNRNASHGTTPDTIFFMGDTILFYGDAHGDTSFCRNKWNMVRTDSTSPDKTTLTFTPSSSGYNLPYCGTFCFQIPQCIRPPMKHVITVNAYPNDSCPDPCGMNVDSAVFKATGELPPNQFIITQPHNYPNPFGSNSMFKTIIPFETSGSGGAEIEVFDESGRVVLKDNETVLGPGRHMFYFTAKALPAGKYFYNIQFPHGSVIARNAMILIR